MGGCFLSLSDFSIDDILFYSTPADDKTITTLREKLKIIRVLQFFEPPMDELILTAGSVNNGNIPLNVNKLAELSSRLKHPPVANEILKGFSHDDAINVLKELAKEKLIGVDAELILTPEGRKLTLKISKSPQENFVIRLIKGLNISFNINNIFKTS